MKKMNNVLEREDFISNLYNIIGKTVTNVLAGGGSNGTFFITFGKSEFMISCSCAWRLVHENKVITGWTEPDFIGGPLNKNLILLTNDKVKNITISTFNDLRISFESGKVMDVFCDITPQSEISNFNWDFTIFKINKTYSVYKDQNIVVEPYDPDNI